MKSKALGSAVRVFPFLFLVSASCALAQEHRHIHFAGLLNDYTPVSPLISGSPYEMHGQWSVDLREGGVADFFADMTMSDFGTTNGVLDATKGGQNAHTHHVRLTNVRVTWDMIGCPTYSPATLRAHDSTYIDASGLCHRRKRGSVFKHDDGLRRTCDKSFRDAGYSWSRA